MSNRRKGKSEQRTVDWSKIVHPSLRVSNHGGGEIKPKTLSSGCILYGYDMFTSYRKRGLRT
jgi:hypothetical protein